MEIIDVILEHAGNPAILGIALGPVVMAIVGLIRGYTGADGPVVKWIAFGVSVAAVALFNVVEGGMTFLEGLLTAAIGAIVAIGSHETGGKWLREMIGALVGKSRSEPPAESQSA